MANRDDARVAAIDKLYKEVLAENKELKKSIVRLRAKVRKSEGR